MYDKALFLDEKIKNPSTQLLETDMNKIIPNLNILYNNYGLYNEYFNMENDLILKLQKLAKEQYYSRQKKIFHH